MQWWGPVALCWLHRVQPVALRVLEGRRVFTRFRCVDCFCCCLADIFLFCRGVEGNPISAKAYNIKLEESNALYKLKYCACFLKIKMKAK